MGVSHEGSPPDLSTAEIDILITIERVGAGLSMFAIVLTITSFLLFKKLRTTPNLFLFFASTANAGASIASMMGYDGLQQGENSSLCQTQAFIFQWFMQSDPWWSFAMAVNVYLVFFFNANPESFKRYVWIYCVVCFGGPLLTAVVLISIHGDARGPVYGDAALWCWIGSNWSLVRLYSYYIPIWLCIFLCIVVYVAVGYHVFHHRNQLRNVAFAASEPDGKLSTISVQHSEGGDSAEESLTRGPDFYGTAVTEVQITSDFQKKSGDNFLCLPPTIHPSAVGYDPSWSSRDLEHQDEAGPSNNAQRFETVCTSDNRPHAQRKAFSRLRAVKSSASLKLKRLDPVKMAYLRTSFIFGFAVLITWIPSSINRLYSLANDGTVSFPLSVASGCVLPLQGVWNAIIYFTTSWGSFKEEMKTLRDRFSRQKKDMRRTTARLESRLDGFSGEHRDTFDRCRIPSVKVAGSNHDLYDLELDECYQGRRSSDHQQSAI